MSHVSPTCKLKRHELLTIPMIGPENPQALPPAEDDDPPASRAARQRAAPAGRPQPRQLARGMEEAIEPPLGLLASRRTQAPSRKSRALKRADNKHVNRRSARVSDAAAEKAAGPSPSEHAGAASCNTARARTTSTHHARMLTPGARPGSNAGRTGLRSGGDISQLHRSNPKDG
jgi:hypothetical protein